MAVDDRHTIPPTPVTVLVTERPSTAPIGDGGTLRLTANHTLVFAVMTPLAQALVRALRTFLQGWVGFLLLSLAARPTLETLGVVIPADDFLQVLWTAAGLSLAPTVIALLQNLIEVFTKLDEAFPKLRA